MAKISKLIPHDVVAEMTASGRLDELHGRCVGASTACALEILAQAMHDPGIKIKINRFTIKECEVIASLVENIITKMGYKCFKMTSRPLTITYNPWIN